jgi:hypothetical protein
MKIIGWWSVALGLLLPIVGCLWTPGAGIPYQDSTPELQQKYAKEAARAFLALELGLGLGAVLLVVGFALLIYSAVLRQRAWRARPHAYERTEPPTS